MESGVLAESEHFEHCIGLDPPLFLNEKLCIVGQAEDRQKPAAKIAKKMGRPASTVYCILAQKVEMLFFKGSRFVAESIIICLK